LRAESSQRQRFNLNYPHHIALPFFTLNFATNFFPFLKSCFLFCKEHPREGARGLRRWRRWYKTSF
jgi:hypothetical protein